MRQSFSPDGKTAKITVRGIRRDYFVEFEYALCDGELAVELVLPIPAFDEFAADRNAELSFDKSDDRQALARLRGRSRQIRLVLPSDTH